MAETTKKTQTTKGKTPVKKTANKAVNSTPAKTTNSKVVKKKPVVKTTKAVTSKTKTAPVKKTVVRKPVSKSVKPIPVSNTSDVKAAAKTVNSKTQVSKSVEKKATTITKTPVKKTVAKKTITKVSPTKKVVTKNVTAKLSGSKKKTFFPIKEVFADIASLYKNFLHWNLSKVVIVLWSIVLGGLAVLPFLIGLFIFMNIKGVDIFQIMDSVLIYGFFSENFIGILLIILIIALFIIFYSYSNVLLMNVNSSYQEGKKLAIQSNEYFKIKKIIKFFNLSIINAGILLIPFILWIIVISSLVYTAGGLQNAITISGAGMNNYITIIGFSSTVILSLLLMYLYFRVVFSYFIFSDKEKYEDNKSVLEYLKGSFKLTNKFSSFFKFVLMIIVCLIFVYPFGYLEDKLEIEGSYLNSYSNVMQYSEETIREKLGDDEMQYYEFLKVKYEGKSVDEVNRLVSMNSFYTRLFSVVDFVVLYGLFIMLFSSFYRRELV